jgi:hypothetical protein
VPQFGSGVMFPVKIMLSAKVMVTCLVVNLTVQPASQNWPIDRREGHVRAGTMCTRRAARGGMGKSSLASCADIIMLLLGLRIIMGVRVVHWLMTGTVMVVKWAVLPVLAIAMFVSWGGVLKGGPMVLLCGDDAAIKQ